MNLFRVFNLLILSLLLWSGSLAAFPGDIDKLKYSSINELTGKSLLQASIMGIGGHEGECISVYLKNPSSDTVFIRIEPGRMLSSLDTSIQDILITREELLALAPGKKTTVTVFGFCCQATKTSPDSSGIYRAGEMADSSVVVLAEFLNERENDFPEDAIQQAIWCMTDDYDISGIYCEDLASIADLRNMVVHLKGMDNRWHHIGTIPDNGEPFIQYTKTISGEFEIFIPADCIVDILICDEGGAQWDEFEKNVPFKAGTYQYSFRITASNWPHGTYFLYFKADGVILYKKAFDI